MHLRLPDHTFHHGLRILALVFEKQAHSVLWRQRSDKLRSIVTDVPGDSLLRDTIRAGAF